MLTTILALIVILGLVIFVHELGHFVTAKKMGVAVEEFGFGYPPRIFGIKKGETIYSINWLPLGGFVKIKGEQGNSKDDKDSFAHKKIWQRTLILSSGVIMNILLAGIILSIGFYIGLPSVISNDLPTDKIRDQKIQIVSIASGSPAEQAKFEVGDTLKSIDGVQFNKVEEVQEFNKERLGQTVLVAISRGDELIEKEVTLKEVDEKDAGKLGVGLVETGIISYSWYRAIWEGFRSTVFLTWQIIVAFYELLKNLIITQTVPADIAGPIGIAVLTSRVTQLGFIYILQFTALLSINLAILNFIPFPALDGGRVFLLLIEKIRRKALNQKVESIIHTTGFFLIIAFLVVISIRDVSRFKESIIGFFRNIIG